MYFKTAAVIIYFTGIAVARAQTPAAISTDSTALKKATAAFALVFKNADSALLLSNQALQLSIEIKNLQAEANAYTSIGWCYMHKGNLDTAIIFLLKAWQLFQQTKANMML